MWRTKSQRTWCSLTFVLFVHVSALLLCNLASLSVKLSLFFWRSSRESLWCCRQLDEWAPTRCACWDSGYHGDVQFWLDNASFFSFFFAAVSERNKRCNMIHFRWRWGEFLQRSSCRQSDYLHSETVSQDVWEENKNNDTDRDVHVLHGSSAGAP